MKRYILTTSNYEAIRSKSYIDASAAAKDYCDISKWETVEEATLALEGGGSLGYDGPFGIALVSSVEIY